MPIRVRKTVITKTGAIFHSTKNWLRRFDSCRPALSSPRLNQRISSYPAYDDPILTASSPSPFRFIRTSLRGGTARTRQFASGRGEKDRVPCCESARGGKTACRVNRCRGGLFAAKQENPRNFRGPGGLR